ncbi:kit ligand a [Aplochiton taeniatus]
MKKSKSWIRVCVHLLLCITLGVHSSEFEVNPVTDDITRLSVLKHNIPKDYKIPVQYIPREEGGMCWVKLNVFYLEDSLKELSHKFGNISSNRKDISIFIQMLQEVRLNMESLELTMLDFECHYRKEWWPTAQYFEFVEDFLLSAQLKEDSADCEPPPCNTSTTVQTTQYSTTVPPKFPKGPADCNVSSPDCRSSKEPLRFLPEVVERSLLSLLLIPIAALICLFIWKVKSTRNRDPEENTGERDLFTGTEGNATPLDVEVSEKNRLNAIEIV